MLGMTRLEETKGEEEEEEEEEEGAAAENPKTEESRDAVRTQDAATGTSCSKADATGAVEVPAVLTQLPLARSMDRNARDISE